MGGFFRMISFFYTHNKWYWALLSPFSTAFSLYDMIIGDIYFLYNADFYDNSFRVAYFICYLFGFFLVF